MEGLGLTGFHERGEILGVSGLVQAVSSRKSCFGVNAERGEDFSGEFEGAHGRCRNEISRFHRRLLAKEGAAFVAGCSDVFLRIVDSSDEVAVLPV